MSAHRAAAGHTVFYRDASTPSLRHGFQSARRSRRRRSSARTASSAARAADGLWRRDPSVWSIDRCGRRTTIANRLGWLDSPALMLASVDRIRSVASEVRDAGFTDVVLLGMGGSSLAPEVLRAVVGEQPGWPRLHMLDSTDPAAVRAVGHTPARTLYHPGEQVGHDDRTELARGAFSARAAGQRRRRAGPITSSRSPTKAPSSTTRARTEAIPRRVHQPVRHRRPLLRVVVLRAGAGGADGTGRQRAARLGRRDARGSAGRATSTSVPNPAVALGLLMGAAARAGRDKLTLILPPRARAASGCGSNSWSRKAPASSGVGVVPIAGETLGDARCLRTTIGCSSGCDVTDAPAAKDRATVR